MQAMQCDTMALYTATATEQHASSRVHPAQLTIAAASQTCHNSQQAAPQLSEHAATLSLQQCLPRLAGLEIPAESIADLREVRQGSQRNTNLHNGQQAAPQLLGACGHEAAHATQLGVQGVDECGAAAVAGGGAGGRLHAPQLAVPVPAG